MPTPSLDSWTIIFLIAAAQGIFLSVLMFLKAKEQPRILLGLIVMLFSITLIDYVAFWTDYRFIFPHINRISGAFPFLFGPLFYFYLKLFIDNEKLAIRDYLHLIPFVLYFITLIPYLILDGSTKVEMLIDREFYLFGNELIQNSLIFIGRYIPVLMTTHLCIYTVLGLKFISDSNISKATDEIKRWLNVIRFAFVGFVACFTSYYVMVYMFSYNLTYDYAISIAMSVFIYSIGYFGYLSPEVFSGSIDEHYEKQKYSNSGLTDREATTIKEKLLTLMEREKVYLKSDLKLNDLAQLSEESKHHVSQVINNELNTTFSAFVNEYRIKESKKLLSNGNQELNMFGIARESGFNNKTTFSLAFKRHTGISPSSYKELSDSKK
jgi:AraC-like DNA-binding protein